MRPLPNLHFASRSTFAPLIFAGVLLSFLLGSRTAPASPVPPIAQNFKIPVGTVLPISLEHPLASKGLTKGETIEGRIMQDVPLPNKEKIPAGAKIHGKILSAFAADKGAASITFRVESLELHHLTVPIVTGLRAMAPFEDIQAAHAPYQEVNGGSPDSWATTIQIGGDMRYGSGGKVIDRHHRTVGKATTDDGVLVHLQDAPDSPCAGWPDGSDRLQSLWVFSADACGLFDLQGMCVAHAGNTEPLGEITLTKAEGDIKIMKSSGMLLRVVR